MTGTSSSLARRLQGAGDLGDLLLAAVDARPALHELEVVDDDQAQLRPSALRRRALARMLQDREGRGVVDVDGRGPESPGRILELGPVLVG